MPRWADNHVTDSAIYLYESVGDADSGANIGGAGFLVGVPWDAPHASSASVHVYAVTSYHVVKGKAPGSCVIRLNTNDGKSASIETEPHEWFSQYGHDLAVYRIDASKHFRPGSIYDYKFNDFPEINLKSAIIQKFNLGVGDDVFSVGRFVDIHRTQHNTPLVRSGIVAATGEITVRTDDSLPWDREPVWVVEMRSRTGFSGSPVFVYIDRLTVRFVDTEEEVDPWEFHGPWLLGVQSGQFPTDEPGGAGAGMATVVPCTALAELLLRDENLKKERAEYEDIWLRSPKVIAESALPTKVDNPQHAEDFNRLLGAAAKGRKPGDRP